MIYSLSMYGLMFDIHVSKQIKIQQSISNILLMIIRFRDSAILNEIGVIHPIAIEMIYTFFLRQRFSYVSTKNILH